MKIRILLLISGILLLSKLCFAVDPIGINSAPIMMPEANLNSSDYSRINPGDMLPSGISWYMIGVDDETGEVLEGYMTNIGTDGSVEYKVLGEDYLEEIKTGGNK